MLKPDNAQVGSVFTKGQKLLVLRNEKYYDGEIENIRVDEVDYDKYEKVETTTEIGLKIYSTCKITKDCRIKFIT